VKKTCILEGGSIVESLCSIDKFHHLHQQRLVLQIILTQGN